MNILIFLTGALLVYGLQLLFSRLVWKRKLRAGVSFSDGQAVEGDRIKLTFTVENDKLLPLISVRTNVQLDRGLDYEDMENLAVSDKNYRSEIFSLKAFERVQRDIPLVCNRRGYYHLDRIDFIGHDLFYTRRFLGYQKTDAALLILPGKADARQLMVAAQRMTGENVVRRADCDDPFTFRGIRQYQNYDSIRDINWKATARTGELRVNIHDYTSEQEIVILLDTEWDSLLKPDSLLEESIRIAGSLAEEFTAQGIRTSLSTNGYDCVSEERVVVAGGADISHSHAIRMALARIRLLDKRKDSTMEALLREQVEEMDRHPARRVSFVLISTETEESINNLWRELSARAVMGYRILPAHSQGDIPLSMQMDPQLMFWEVSYGR